MVGGVGGVSCRRCIVKESLQCSVEARGSRLKLLLLLPPLGLGIAGQSIAHSCRAPRVPLQCHLEPVLPLLLWPHFEPQL